MNQQNRLLSTGTDAEVTDLLGDVTQEMLQATFDWWTIGETSGRLLAFRSGAFTAEGPRSLIRACVIAGTAAELAEQLCVQAWLESLSAAELEAVWHKNTMAEP